MHYCNYLENMLQFIHTLGGIMMQKKKWVGMIVIIVAIHTCMLFGKDKLNDAIPKDWLGASVQSVEDVAKKVLSTGKIKVVQNKEGIITDVFIRGTDAAIDSIRVGDSLEKVLKVYPKEWIESYPSYILVLKGRERLFGVASDYIIYRIKDQKVEEIQLGYTNYFEEMGLPKSNEEADKLLQGEWVSEHNTQMKFEKGNLEDSLLRDLYDYQQYRVIAPNKLLIMRSKDGHVEKVYLRFLVDEDTLYIFDTNELGIPIRETVERFTHR